MWHLFFTFFGPVREARVGPVGSARHLGPARPRSTLHDMSVDPPRIAELAARSRAVLERAGAHLRKTPLVPCPRLSEAIGGEVHLKLESLQATGSFKLRGAFARLTAESPTPARVVTASTGNHGAAVAHAARSLGIEAVVYVPRTAAAAKVDKIRTLGALVREAGEDCVEAEAEAALALDPEDPDSAGLLRQARKLQGSPPSGLAPSRSPR